MGNRTYGKFGEIKNPNVFGHEDHEDGPCITYQLSPEELERYRTPIKEKEAKEIMSDSISTPVPTKEEVIELIKKHRGNITHMANAKYNVSESPKQFA